MGLNLDPKDFVNYNFFKEPLTYEEAMAQQITYYEAVHEVMLANPVVAYPPPPPSA